MILRTVAAATLIVLTGCVHGKFFIQPKVDESSFAETLGRTQDLAAARQYDAANRALVGFATEHPGTADATETLYWRAVLFADPANDRGSLDSAIVLIDQYLATTGSRPALHAREAPVLRHLARDAQQLGRVQLALQQVRTVAENKRSEDPKPQHDDEAAKEVQRLKEELSKARDELERIKKRLAAPKP